MRGLLRRAGEPGAPHLVEAIDFDGARCRYLTIGSDDTRWLDERPDDDYRACAAVIVARLLALGREPGASTAAIHTAVTGTSVDRDGRIRIGLRETGRHVGRWVEA